MHFFFSYWEMECKFLLLELGLTHSSLIKNNIYIYIYTHTYIYDICGILLHVFIKNS